MLTANSKIFAKISETLFALKMSFLEKSKKKTDGSDNFLGSGQIRSSVTEIVFG
jgi:hypothetical protein